MIMALLKCHVCDDDGDGNGDDDHYDCFVLTPTTTQAQAPNTASAHIWLINAI